jgi:hypothetical protein
LATISKRKILIDAPKSKLGKKVESKKGTPLRFESLKHNI